MSSVKDYPAETAAVLLNALHTMDDYSDRLDTGIDNSMLITSRAVNGNVVHLFSINPQGLLTDHQVCLLDSDDKVSVVWRGAGSKVLAAIKSAGVKTAGRL